MLQFNISTTISTTGESIHFTLKNRHFPFYGRHFPTLIYCPIFKKTNKYANSSNFNNTAGAFATECVVLSLKYTQKYEYKLGSLEIKSKYKQLLWGINQINVVTETLKKETSGLQKFICFVVSRKIFDTTLYHIIQLFVICSFVPLNTKSTSAQRNVCRD